MEIQVLEQEIAQLEKLLQQTPKGKRQRQLKNKLKLWKAELRREATGDWGRKIPEPLKKSVQARDMGRSFGRPNHCCRTPGDPHHIRHFADFRGAHTRECPHKAENLDCPCDDCHRLAHAMNVPSGTSIEDFFRSIDESTWRHIERIWASPQRGNLREIAGHKSS